MAWLLKEELPDVDMEKVIHMCLLHDLGEAVTGDIPAFEKKEQDRNVERKAVDGLLSMLPGKTGEEAKCFCRDECAQDRGSEGLQSAG